MFNCFQASGLNAPAQASKKELLERRPHETSDKKKIFFGYCCFKYLLFYWLTGSFHAGSFHSSQVFHCRPKCWGKSKMIFPKFVLRLTIFKILQLKISNFPLTSALPFCQYFDRRLPFRKLWIIFIEKQLILYFWTFTLSFNNFVSKCLLRLMNIK